MAVSNQTTQVYHDLKEKILKGVYSPSENLPEVELANTYMVSRNTIKKVLLMLESQNLVTIEQNKGAKVRSYSIEEVIEFLQVRSVLEGFITRMAVPCFTDKEISELEGILAVMKQSRESRDLLQYSSYNQEFHQVIYRTCPNKTAVSMTVNLKEQMRKYNTKTILVPNRDVESFSEHSAIFDSIKNRNPDLAEMLMKQHINNVLKTFQENVTLLF